MNTQLRKHVNEIVEKAIAAVRPDEAVARALEGKKFDGRVFIVSVGKAGWQMAKAAGEVLKDKITSGVVCTKYDHVMGDLPNITCFEGGHPVPDENSFRATDAALDLVSDLSESDTVLFLLSGGGSALFEKPLIPAEELQNLTNDLLACGADIVEINTIRKRLSAVKGGRFAKLCKPAKVFSVVLSDILGDSLDMIASGPAVADSSTCEQALNIVKKYNLNLSSKAMELLKIETPKELDNVTTQITGSVRELCISASNVCKELGYEPIVLTDQLCCQAREAGSFLASVIKTHYQDKKSLAFLAGGETVVKLIGKGKGGRNQELALSAAIGIAGMKDVAIFSVGSDGTDGPTDAAGGYVDGDTVCELSALGVSVDDVLANNDAYCALEKTNGLIITGPTGTNVNDIAIALIKYNN